MKVWIVKECYADDKLPCAIVCGVHETKDGALKQLRNIYLDIISDAGFEDNIEDYDNLDFDDDSDIRFSMTFKCDEYIEYEIEEYEVEE